MQYIHTSCITEMYTWGVSRWQWCRWIFLTPPPRNQTGNKTKVGNIHPELPIEDYLKEIQRRAKTTLRFIGKGWSCSCRWQASWGCREISQLQRIFLKGVKPGFQAEFSSLEHHSWKQPHPVVKAIELLFASDRQSLLNTKPLFFLKKGPEHKIFIHFGGGIVAWGEYGVGDIEKKWKSGCQNPVLGHYPSENIAATFPE